MNDKLFVPDDSIYGAFVEAQIEKIISFCEEKITKNDRVDSMKRIKEACQKAINTHNTKLQVAFCQDMGIKL